ncbi:MAG: tetratricopeptide repeat-containing protein [Cyanothece sp. SIO1E1]|nr:tetratricopeptide repeat-containing protein [Cyanothece sp. SIO1E1]
MTTQISESVDFATLGQQYLHLCVAQGNQRGQCAALDNLGLAHRALGQTETALDYHQQSLAIAQVLESPYDQAGAWNNLGLIHLSQSHYSIEE